jgi:hypothetical protein
MPTHNLCRDRRLRDRGLPAVGTRALRGIDRRRPRGLGAAFIDSELVRALGFTAISDLSLQLYVNGAGGGA